MNKVNFSDVVEFLEGPGVRKWQFRDDGIKLINIRNLVNDKLDLSNTSNFLDLKEVNEKYKHFLLDKGDFIIASSGVTWGKIAEIESCHLPLCLNTSIIKLRSKDANKLEKRFLWHFIKSFSFRRQIDRIITGSAQPNFGPSHLAQIQIPLPPLETQKKIAAILDAADDYRQLTKALIAKYDQLAQSLFLDMFGDPVRNEKGWEVSLFTEVLVLKRGYDLPVQNRNKGKIPIMASNGILGYHDKYMVRGPGVVTGRSGTLGQVHLVEDDYWPLNTALYSKNMNGNNPIYLSYLLRYFHVERFSRGAGVPTLNRNLVHSELIIKVPIHLQTQFADRIQLIEAQKQQAQASLQKAEELFNSLLQRAFLPAGRQGKGELG